MLSSTARVVLGMIRLGKTTGYEIKQLVDVSARFFWSASYGQIYPELRRLEEAGLIESENGARNGRRRRAYSLTPAGEQALDEWLRAPGPGSFEVRDEGMLKLFFSDSMSDDELRGLLEDMRDRHAQIVASLESIEEAAAAKGGGPYMTLRLGLGHHRAFAKLCDELAAEATVRR